MLTAKHNDALRISINMDYSDVHWFLLRSDAHHDSPLCETKLEKRHLDEAGERGAGIMDFGDLFDAMQGPHDKRRSLAVAEKEDYFNDLLSNAEAFYRPYADRFVMLAQGNHEASVVKHNALDLTKELARRLGCAYMPFSGWVRFQFTLHETQKESKNLWYTHGSGGNSPVTRGVIKTNRRQVYLPDADIIVGGHSHNEWIVPIARKRLSNGCVEYADECLHIQLPSYKRPGQWEMEREFAPLTTGAYWLRFYVKDKRVQMEVTRA